MSDFGPALGRRSPRSGRGGLCFGDRVGISGRTGSRGRGRRRGLTLVEMMIAVTVLAIGIAGAAAILDKVEQANRTEDLIRTANDAFSRLAAQIRDAQCDYPGDADPPVIHPATTDPGLRVTRVWISVPEAQSFITFVGATDGSDVDLGRTVPPVRIDYFLEPTVPPSLPGFDIQIRVRRIMGDPALDDPALTEGWWIKNYTLTKICNPRFDETRRGEYL